MKNHEHTAEIGQDIILIYLKQRMREKKVSLGELSTILNVSTTTLWRYFNKKAQVPLGIYLEICCVLELYAYLIPVEIEEMKKHHRMINE